MAKVGRRGRVAFPLYSAVMANQSRPMRTVAAWLASAATRGGTGSKPSPPHYSARAKIKEAAVMPRFSCHVRSNQS